MTELEAYGFRQRDWKAGGPLGKDKSPAYRSASQLVLKAVDRPLAMTLAFHEVIYVHGSSSAPKPPSARRAPEMRILLSSRRTSPLVFDRTPNN